HAARHRRAVVQARLHRDQMPVQSSGHEGLRRSGRDRRTGGGDERRDRRLGRARPADAGNAAHGVESDACHEDGRGLRDESTRENFNYHRPTKPADAVKAMKKAKDGKFLSGGMTLLPTMKQGLAAPSDIIDLGGLKNSGVAVAAAKVTVKAGTPH